MESDRTHTLLEHLQSAGIADAKLNDDNVLCWRLTEYGKTAVQCGVPIHNATQTFAPRDVLASQMEVYELMVSLQSLGWHHVAISSRSDLKSIVAEPYVVGRSPKAWFTRVGQGSLNRDYLQLLLTAPEHKLEVPHFAHANDYARMLGKVVRVFATRARALCHSA